jgi:hypothetical protein
MPADGTMAARSDCTEISALPSPGQLCTKYTATRGRGSNTADQAVWTYRRYSIDSSYVGRASNAQTCPTVGTCPAAIGLAATFVPSTPAIGRELISGTGGAFSSGADIRRRCPANLTHYLFRQKAKSRAIFLSGRALLSCRKERHVTYTKLKNSSAI